MALSKNVYISDVTNLTEARYYAGMGVSIVGFNATPGALTYADTQLFDAITSWLAGIQTCWQWSGKASEALANLQQETPADFIELDHVPEEEELPFLAPPLLLRLSSPEKLQAISRIDKGKVAGIVWEGDPALLGPAQTFHSFYVYLKPPFEPIDSIPALEHCGISLKGVPESRPGWNDFDQLADLLESLETY